MTQIISFLFHILFFFTPLIFWPQMSEVFEFPKMLFVYTMTTLITAAWIINWIKNKKITIARTPLDIPILIFLTIQILSTIFSIDPHTSLWGYYSRFHGGLASTLCYILLFYAFVSQDRPPVISYIHTLLLSTTLISAYAVLEHFGIDKNLWVQDVQNRVFSTLGQPNWLSAYLAAILPLFIFSKSKIFNTLSVLVITAIIFTKSQSGIAAMITVLVIIFFIKTKTKLKFLLPLLFIPLIPKLTRSLSSLNQINPFYSTTTEIAQQDLETRGNGGSDSMAIRRVVWQGAINLGLKHPILGTGPETFAYSYYQTRPTEHNLLSEWDFLYNKAHNEYLNFFANSGFLGLGSYILFIGWTITWWIKSIKKIKKLKLINSSLLVGWLSILITNFFGFSVVAVALLFFLFPALVISPRHPEHICLRPGIRQRFLHYAIAPVGMTAIFLLVSIYHTFKADILYNLSKNSQDPLTPLQQAVGLQPNQPLFLAQLAEAESKTAATIYLQLENLPETAKQVQEQYQQQAINRAAQAVNMNPYNLNLLKSKARVEIYLSNIDKAYTQQALNSLLQASLLAPTDAKLFYNIGLLYQSLGQNQPALQAFQKALELKPNYPEARYNIEKL